MSNQDKLKPREIDILRLMAEDLTNREIAERLYIGVETVRWYAKQIYSKLGVAGREEAAEKAQELGLLDEESERQIASKTIPHNLPVQMTQFIGRETEIQNIQELLLESHNRLVTILAPGGMGKTRLAIEIGKRFITSDSKNEYFRDGVFFAPLQPLSEPNQIISQIANSINFRFTPDQRETKQQLLGFLKKKEILLLIDNWEHLLEGVSLANDILRAAPQIKVLATSREKLNLSGETIYVLAGMQFPDWETPSDAQEYDAVKLLIQSVQRVKPDWTVTFDNLNYVARVCRLTQGMPLGIILAASWLDVLTLDRIAAEIQKSADFLETEMRDVPERQRSIRAVFDWTWQQLGEAEQQVFMKLSVFRGGFTPESGEAVAGATIRSLQSLINKALVMRDPIGRYDIHELLRQYGELKLAQSSAIDRQTRDDHAIFYAHIVGNYQQKCYGEDPLPAFQEGRDEFGNIMIAWDWILKNTYPNLLSQMAQGLSFLLYNMCRFQEGSENFREAITRIDQKDIKGDYESLHAILSAHYAYHMSYYASETQTLAVADHVSVFFEKYDMASASPDLVHGYLTLGNALRLSRPHQAQAIFEEIIHLSEEKVGFNLILSESLWQWAFTQTSTYVETIDTLEKVEEALANFKRMNSHVGTSLCAGLLGIILFQRQDYTSAKPNFIDAARAFELIGDYFDLAAVYAWHIRIAIKQNNAVEAQQIIHKLLSILPHLGWNRNTLAVVLAIAEWYVFQNDAHRALEIAVFASSDVPFTPYAVNMTSLNQLINEHKSRLSPDEFKQAVARGQALEWDTLVKTLQEEFRTDSSS